MTSMHTVQWKRVIVDAIAIVSSILVAFAIDAWWDDRSERIRLAGAIENIADEVKAARVEIENAVARNTLRIEGIRRFLDLDPEELQALPDMSILSFSLVFYTPSPFDSSGYALQALLAGGNLEIIADQELREALLAWAQFPDEIERDYAEALQLSMAMFERMTQHGAYLAFGNLRGDLSIPDIVPARDVLVSMRRDPILVESMAQYLFYFVDFNDQLTDGIGYADRVLNASRL